MKNFTIGQSVNYNGYKCTIIDILSNGNLILSYNPMKYLPVLIHDVRPAEIA